MSYYITLAKTILRIIPTADIHVFSEGTEVDFTALSNLNKNHATQNSVTLHLNTAPDIAWAHMMLSEMFVMAPSAFSEVPALYSSGIVVYAELKHRHMYPLKHWISADDVEPILTRMAECGLAGSVQSKRSKTEVHQEETLAPETSITSSRNQHSQHNPSSNKQPSFAVGVNTGSGVQNLRVPAILATWLRPPWNKNALILSDTADSKLGITAVPAKYLCSTLKGRDEKELTHRSRRYWEGWKWFKGTMPKKERITMNAVATNTSRCIQYR
jgi:hypothetical protein